MKVTGRQRVRRRLSGFITWCAALLLGTALFHALGDGSLTPPPLDPSGWGPWIEGRDALVATMALLRLLVVALCWYLIGVTSVGTVARLLRAARLIRLADALTVPFVRQLLQQTLGVVLATTVVTATTGPSLAAPVGVPVPSPSASAAHVATDMGEDDAPADAMLDPAWFDAALPARVPARTGVGIARRTQASAERPPVQGPATDDPPEVTLRGLPAPGDAEGPPLPWRIAEAEAPPIPDELADVSVAEVAPDSCTDGIPHLVRSGESLWRIASHRLQVVFDRPPTDAEIVPYWRELIAVNRDRLPDRDDPDLILPGQELLLPPVAAP